MDDGRSERQWAIEETVESERRRERAWEMERADHIRFSSFTVLSHLL